MTTSITKEQADVPPQGSALQRQAKLMIEKRLLPANEQIALVRCEAGRTYSKEPHAGRRLARKGLVEKNAWKVTPLGAAVVEELCR